MNVCVNKMKKTSSLEQVNYDYKLSMNKKQMYFQKKYDQLGIQVLGKN